MDAFPELLAQDFRAVATRLECLTAHIPRELRREIELLVQTLRDQAERLSPPRVNYWHRARSRRGHLSFANED
jgi:hypothetical protein